MLLRIIQGTVRSGRESDFVALCRRQVADLGRSPGLLTFMAGYRRVTGVDRFILAATWESEAAAVAAAGEHDRPTAADVMSEIADVESVELYDVIPPAFTGIVDAPGGIIRVTRTRVTRDGRVEPLDWLSRQRRRGRDDTQRLLLGWALGQRRASHGDGIDIVAVSAWPSPLVIESIADPGRHGTSLYSALDEVAPAATSEQFRAIGLDLPDELADLGSRRIIAARFETRRGADDAQCELVAALALDSGAQLTVAPLGAPGRDSDAGGFVLVARVALRDYGRAERLIADLGGDVILSQPDVASDPATLAASDETGARALDAGDLATGFSPS